MSLALNSSSATFPRSATGEGGRAKARWLQSKDKTLHLIVGNYATHKHAAVQAWLAKHPGFNMHFAPTSASWLNVVERFFRDLTTERLRRRGGHGRWASSFARSI